MNIELWTFSTLNKTINWISSNLKVIWKIIFAQMKHILYNKGLIFFAGIQSYLKKQLNRVSDCFPFLYGTEPWHYLRNVVSRKIANFFNFYWSFNFQMRAMHEIVILVSHYPLLYQLVVFLHLTAKWQVTSIIDMFLYF